MRTTLVIAAVSIVYASEAFGDDIALSDTARQVADLNDQKTLISTQKEVIAAQKELLTAQRALTDEKTKNTGTARTLADVQAVAGTTVPSVGNVGTVNIAENKEAVFLKTQQGSLRMLNEIATEVCNNLPSGSYFIETRDFQSRAAIAKLSSNNFESEYLFAINSQHRVDVGLKPISASEVHLAGAEVIAAVGLVGYAANAVESLLKYFRTDISIQFKNTDRSDWLPGLLSANCPAKISTANANQEALLDVLTSTPENPSVLAKLNQIKDFVRYYKVTQANQDSEIAKKQTDLDKAKKGGNATEVATKTKQLLEANNRKMRLLEMEEYISNMRAILDGVSNNPKIFIDNMTASRLFDSMQGENGHIQLILNLTIQDAQMKKARWWRSDAYYAQSYGELLYEAVTANGQVVAAGALSSQARLGEIDVDTAVTLNTRTEYVFPRTQKSSP